MEQRRPLPLIQPKNRAISGVCGANCGTRTQCCGTRPAAKPLKIRRKCRRQSFRALISDQILADILVRSRRHESDMSHICLGDWKLIREKGVEMQEENDKDVREPSRKSQEEALQSLKTIGRKLPVDFRFERPQDQEC